MGLMAVVDLPRALTSYPDRGGQSLLSMLVERAHIEPFNAIATAIFALAIVHTFGAARGARRAHRLPTAPHPRARSAGLPTTPSLSAELLHFLGEVEVVF